MYLKIETINEKYSNFLYKLRNDEESRDNSLNKKIISFSNHKIWLNNFLKKSNGSIFIFLNKKNSKIGYVRFEEFKKKIFVSIAIIKKYRNKGLSKIMLKKAEDLTKGKYFYASINKKNFKSIALFTRLNYYKYKMTKQFILMKKNSNNHLGVINKIEKIRSKNNVNSMKILRLAPKSNPESAQKKRKKINHDNKKSSNLLRKLS